MVPHPVFPATSPIPIDGGLPLKLTTDTMKPKPLSNGLSAKANNCLTKAGVPAEKEAVRQARLAEVLYPHRQPRGYGKITHQEVCRWVGLPYSFSLASPDRPLAICPCCGSVVPQSDIKWQTAPPSPVSR